MHGPDADGFIEVSVAAVDSAADVPSDAPCNDSIQITFVIMLIVIRASVH